MELFGDDTSIKVSDQCLVQLEYHRQMIPNLPIEIPQIPPDRGKFTLHPEQSVSCDSPEQSIAKKPSK